MFYLVSIIPLAVFYNDQQRFLFYLKIISIIHVYRETGRIYTILFHKLTRIKIFYSEYNTFINLSRFSLEIFLGLSIYTLLYYLLSWFDYFTGHHTFIPFLRTTAYAISIAGFLYQCYNWIKARKNKRTLGTLRLWQNIIIYIIYFMFITLTLTKISVANNINSMDDFHHIFIAKIYSTEGMYFPVLANKIPISYPSLYGVWNAIPSIIVFSSPADVVHSQTIIINLTLIFLFLYLLGSIIKIRSFVVYLILPIALFLLPVHNHGGALYVYMPRLVFPLLSANLILMFYKMISPLRGSNGHVIHSSLLFSFIILLNPSCIPYIAAYYVIFLIFLIFHSFYKSKSLRKFFFEIMKNISSFVLVSSIFVISDPYYRNILIKPLFNTSEIKNEHETYDLKNLYKPFFTIPNSDTNKTKNIIVHDSFLRKVKIPVYWLLTPLILWLVFRKLILKAHELSYRSAGQFLLFFTLSVMGERYTTMLFSQGLTGSDWHAYQLQLYMGMNRSNLDEIYLITFIFVFISFISVVFRTLNVYKLRNIKLFIQKHPGQMLLLFMVASYLPTFFTIKHRGFPVKPFYAPVNKYREIFHDDEKFTRWLIENPVSGNIALQSEYMQARYESYLVPYSASLAYILSSSKYNYCFLNLDPVLKFPHIFYETNVKKWNQEAFYKNNIRYWIINKGTLNATVDLDQAIKNGFLKEEKCFGDSCLFKMVYKK